MNEELDFLFKAQDESKDKFKNILSEFILYRFEDDPNGVYGEEYIENEDKYSKYFHQIKSDLSEEKQILLFELDFLVGSNLIIAEKFRYLQGFKDAYKLFTILSS